LKTPLVLLATLALCACASFDPFDGMALQDFKHQAGLAGKGGAELVGSKGNTDVYYLNGATDHDVFYWFDDGILRKVTTGSIEQTKHQIKVMYKAPHLRKKTPKQVSAMNNDVSGAAAN
jgi:hypothetical protein